MRVGRRWYVAVVVLVAVLAPWAGPAAAQEPGTSHSEMPRRDERKPERDTPKEDVKGRPAQETPDERRDEGPEQETPVEEDHRRPAVLGPAPEPDAPVDEPRLGRAPSASLPVTGSDVLVLTATGVLLIAVGWLLTRRRHRSG